MSDIHDTSDPRLTGRMPRLARLGWLAVAFVAIVPTLLSWFPYAQLLHTVCDECVATPGFVSALEQMGISLNLWVLFMIGLSVTVGAGWMGIALLIFLVRSDDRRALLISLLLLLVGPGFGAFPLLIAESHPAWLFYQRTFFFLGASSFGTLTCVFPNGRIAPRWTLWPILLQSGVMFLNAYFPDSALNPLAWPVWLSLPVVMLPMIVSWIGVPLYRYARVFTHSERQQTKWALSGFALTVVGITSTIIATAQFIGRDATPQAGATLVYINIVQMLGYGLSPLMIPIFIGVAVLRARLWDIDIIIRRTLVYAVMTVTLALIYLGSVALLESALRRFTGEGSALAVVLSTLAIAALFNPLRMRVQGFIDKRFFRTRYDAQTTLARFGARLRERDNANLDRLGGELVRVIQDTMQPAHVSFWLKPGTIQTTARSQPFAIKEEKA